MTILIIHDNQPTKYCSYMIEQYNHSKFTEGDSFLTTLGHNRIAQV
jgi:hypothetical protein